MDNLYSYRGFIYQQLKRTYIPEQDLEDVCHDVFVKALENKGHIREGEEYKYLMLQVRSVLFARASRFHNKGGVEEQGMLGDDACDLVESCDGYDFDVTYLHEILRKLTPRMHYSLLHSVKEAAVKFGVTRQAIEKDFANFRLEWAV